MLDFFVVGTKGNIQNKPCFFYNDEGFKTSELVAHKKMFATHKSTPFTSSEISGYSSSRNTMTTAKSTDELIESNYTTASATFIYSKLSALTSTTTTGSLTSKLTNTYISNITTTGVYQIETGTNYKTNVIIHK